MLVIGTMHKTYIAFYDFGRERDIEVKAGQTAVTETHICFPSCSWSFESLSEHVHNAHNETTQFLLISIPQNFSLYLVCRKKS